MSPIRHSIARRAVQRTLLAGLLGLLPAAPHAGADEPAARQYEDALAAARSGALDVALARLAQLTRRFPDDRRYLHDYIAVLQRAQRNDDALALLPRVDRGRAPAYVLEALAAAATDSGKHALADELYLGVLARHPGRAESLRGLADAFAVRSAEAVPAATLATLQTLPSVDRVEVLHRAAMVLEARSRFYPALHLTLAALRSNPAHAAAQALRIRLAARLGAAHLALQLAHAQPGAVDATQLDTLERHVAAVDGRWAGILRGMPHRRVHGTALLDAAIERSDALARRFLEQDARLLDSERRWLYDRMVLLGARGRATEVDALHRTFVQRKLPLPAYAVAAAADANLSLRRPRSAISLYEQVLREQPGDAAARTGMYYALLEAEETTRARTWIDAYAADTAPLPGATPSPADKAQHWQVRVLQARSRQFDGEPAVAHAELERLRREAPANAEVRAGLASVYRARGWPRRAWDAWRIQLLHDPEDVDAYADSVEPLLDTYRFTLADAQLGEARRRDPEARAVARAERAWRLHHRPELLLTATSGRSRDANVPSGNRDRRIEATLYTPPFGERYRAFAHATHLQGELVAGTTHYRRAGAGLEYRGPDLRVTGEWHAGWRNDGGAGLRLGAKWWIDDVWNVAFDGDTRTVEIPLQARAAGVEAKRAMLETEARLHESRAFAAAVGVVDFSDGNNRQSLQLSWREGWLTRPRHWLSSRAELYTSRNSRESAPYFNPPSDFSASLSVTGGWRTFRWYERAFTQELTLTGGRYWQRDVAAGPVWGIEYAHRWDLDERFYLRYGVGRSLHPYDGQQSGRSYLTLDLDWRF